MNTGMIKAILGLTSGACASVVVGHAIQATRPDSLSKIGKITAAIGGFVIGGMVAKAGAEYTEWQIEEIQKMFRS